MSINKIPPETLALIATFLNPGRQLIDATAVCQHWRATLLSSPRLWNRISCSTGDMFETYLKRSKSVPLKVQLHDTSLRLLESLTPHISRLSSLTLVRVSFGASFDFEPLTHHLGNPIPTLNEFGIISQFGMDGLTLPSGVKNDHFLHVKKLRLVQVPFFRAPHVFPQVTELMWETWPLNSMPLPSLVETLVELPTLERVQIVFSGFSRTTITPTHWVTLPNVQRMSLRSSWGDIPNLLEFLKLPSLTSLVVSGVLDTQGPFDILPVTHFSENIPNLAELPEMEVTMDRHRNRVWFRSASQATLDYYIRPRPLGRGPRGHYRKFWDGIPVDSIRKVFVEIETTDGDDEWVVNLLRGLGSLEHLEFCSRCGRTPQHLRQMIIEGVPFPEMESLAVYLGSDCEADRVCRWKDVVDGLDTGISVAWVNDSWISDEEE